MDFLRLNYTLANEDGQLDRSLCHSAGKKILTVAGSGARIVSLLATAPRGLHSFDISKEQIDLTRLRVAATRHLDYEDYLEFWGYTSGATEVDRSKILDTIGLAPDLKLFARELIARSEKEQVGLIYLGRWEKTIRTLSRLLRTILGDRIMSQIVSGASLSQAEKQGGFQDRVRVASAIRLLGNSNFFRSILYGSHFPGLNLASNEVIFYRQLLGKAFEAAPLDKNFFLQMLFFGELTTSEGLPDDAQPSVYVKAQSALRSGVECKFEVCSVQNLNSGFDAQSYDYVYLSDIPSYLSSSQMTTLLADLESLMNKDGDVIIRCYRHQPEFYPQRYWTELEIPKANIMTEKTGAYSYLRLRFHQQNFQRNFKHAGGFIHESAI